MAGLRHGLSDKSGRYQLISGSVSASMSVDVVVPGWSWDFHNKGTFPFYHKISWDVTFGPTITLAPGGTISASGEIEDAPCTNGCFTFGLNGTCGLEAKLGVEANAEVQLFETNHWYSINGGVGFEISGSAETAANAAMSYSKGKSCGETGIYGTSFSIGALELTGTAKLTVNGYGFSFTHQFRAWEGYSYPP